MDADKERRDLAQADHHVLEGERRVAEQENRLAELGRDGHDTQLAQQVLASLKHSLELQYAHRALIIEALKTMKSSST